MEPATEKQIAYIEVLGGVQSVGISKFEASALIGELLEKREELKKVAPPSASMAKRIVDLGGVVPSTKAEAELLYQKLKATSLATDKQKAKARKLNAMLPEGVTFQQAEDFLLGLKLDADSEVGKPPSLKRLELVRRLNGDVSKAVNVWRTEEYIEELKEASLKHVRGSEKEALEKTLDAMEQDLDEGDGAPPSKDQLKRISKLGGDPKSVKAANIWRADEYIEELEAKLGDEETRIDDTFDLFYSEREDSARMALKKPSKSVMGKALKFGDSQGWSQGWDCYGVEDSAFMLESAIYAVAPNLLKPGKAPPEILPEWSKKNTPPAPAPESVQSETMACPQCSHAILVSSLVDGENKCWVCKSTFKVQFE